MRKIGGLFFVIGIVFLVYSFLIEQKQKEDINQLYSALETIRNTDKSESIKQELSDSLNLDDMELTDVLTLSIPSIDLEAPVLPETTVESLNVALTQIKKNQVPGKNNFTIAGHNSAVYGRHFNRLDELEYGDRIYLIDGKKKFAYKVESKTVISPTDLEVLNNVEGKSEITLITCTLNGTKRIAVKGRLI